MIYLLACDKIDLTRVLQARIGCPRPGSVLLVQTGWGFGRADFSRLVFGRPGESPARRAGRGLPVVRGHA